MDTKTNAPDIGGSATTDVSTELIALRADLLGLAESVARLAGETPALAVGSVEASIRRNPIEAVLIAGGVGFLVSLILVR
jgi:hypothetical protein